MAPFHAAQPPRASHRLGSLLDLALSVVTGLFFVGNGVLFPLAAYAIRDLPTYTLANWHFWLTASLAVGVFTPLAVLAATAVLVAVQRLRRALSTAQTAAVPLALLWSLPGLYSNHNAFADWRSGPTATTERVQEAAPIRVDYSGSVGTHHYYDCRLAFADGSLRQVHRYSVGFVSYSGRSDLGDAGDPCHGIRPGEVRKVFMLRKLDALVSVGPAIDVK